MNFFTLMGIFYLETSHHVIINKNIKKVWEENLQFTMKQVTIYRLPIRTVNVSFVIACTNIIVHVENMFVLW